MTVVSEHPSCEAFASSLVREQAGLDTSASILAKIASRIPESDAEYWKVAWARPWGIRIMATGALTTLDWRRQARAIVVMRKALDLRPPLEDNGEQRRHYVVFHRSSDGSDITYHAMFRHDDLSIGLALVVAATALPPTCKLVAKERVIPAEYVPSRTVTEMVMECDDGEEE